MKCCMVPGNGSPSPLHCDGQVLSETAGVKVAALEEGALTYISQAKSILFAREPPNIVFKIVLKNFVIPLINVIHLNLNL